MVAIDHFSRALKLIPLHNLPTALETANCQTTCNRSSHHCFPNSSINYTHHTLKEETAYWHTNHTYLILIHYHLIGLLHFILPALCLTFICYLTLISGFACIAPVCSWFDLCLIIFLILLFVLDVSALTFNNVLICKNLIIITFYSVPVSALG